LPFDDRTSLKSTRAGGYGKTTLKSIFRGIYATQPNTAHDARYATMAGSTVVA
jgi:hypothetical protein